MMAEIEENLMDRILILTVNHFIFRVGHQLAQWLIDNKIIEHIFGPNLHVEVCTISLKFKIAIKPLKIKLLQMN